MGFSVCVISKGQIVYENGFGLSNFDLKQPIDNKTHYRIASISKTITTAALMTLYDKGFFSLDDDISQYLGFSVRNPNFPDSPITIRMILSHTSSIIDGPTYDDFITDSLNNNTLPPPISEILAVGGQYYTPNQFLNKTPGSYFTYSNFNFGIVGTIIEIISKVRFDIYVRQNVLLKLGIDASFNIQDILNISQIAVLYRAVNGTWVPQKDNYNGVRPPPRNLTGYVIGSNGLVFNPAAWCIISAQQLGYFLQMLYKNGSSIFIKIMSQKSIELMNTAVFIYNGSNSDYDGMLSGLIRSYGLGLIISTNTPNVDVIWPGMPMRGHIGESWGLISNAFYDWKTGSGFSFAINGCSHPYNTSNSSAFLLVEQILHNYFYNYLYNKSQINIQEI